jgi:hypothetical protein
MKKVEISPDPDPTLYLKGGGGEEGGKTFLKESFEEQNKRELAHFEECCKHVYRRSKQKRCKKVQSERFKKADFDPKVTADCLDLLGYTLLSLWTILFCWSFEFSIKLTAVIVLSVLNAVFHRKSLSEMWVKVRNLSVFRSVAIIGSGTNIMPVSVDIKIQQDTDTDNESSDSILDTAHSRRVVDTQPFLNTTYYNPFCKDFLNAKEIVPGIEPAHLEGDLILNPFCTEKVR